MTASNFRLMPNQVNSTTNGILSLEFPVHAESSPLYVMHECPDCGQACACDMEDHWNNAASEECQHECENYGEEN